MDANLEGLTDQILNYDPGEQSNRTTGAQVLAAAVASADIEAYDTTTKPKRKKEEPTPTPEPEQEEVARIPLIGHTIVNRYTWTESGRSKVQFLAPVQLAPLCKKKLRTTKKIVPLIEPDICNCFIMDFLPQLIFNSNIPINNINPNLILDADNNQMKIDKNTTNINNNNMDNINE